MDSVAFSDKKLMITRSSPTPMPPPSPLMLKDYLLDDMSSCSSNGFRSIPRRRQCCSKVKFISEFDPKNPKDLKGKPKPMSAFRRASAAVINAVKIFPLSSYKRKSSILSRSLSMKLCKRSFWKKASNKEISFIKSFKCQNENSLSVTQPSSAAAGVGTARKGKSLSTSSSLFTADNLLSSSCNSESSCDNDAVLSPPEKPVSKIVAVTAGNDSSASSTETAKEESCVNNNLEENDQFSPISVLDFPFDNYDNVSWPFRRNQSILEGDKRKLPEKFKIFGSLSKLEPMDLTKRFAMIELTEDNKGVRAEELVEVVKKGCQVGYFKMEGLLVDFFNERINVKAGNLSKSFDKEEAIRVAENWMNGQPEELFLGWEVMKNREVYIKYLENGGKFDEEKEETAKEIEDEIFSSLLDELWL